MKKRLAKGWRWFLCAAPLAAAAGSAAFLPLQRLGQQFILLIVLVWIQVFFIFEIFLANK